MVNYYTIYDEIGKASNDRAFPSILPIKVFSRFIAMPEFDFWCIHAWGKQTREMIQLLSKRDQP